MDSNRMWHLDTQRGTADVELPRLEGRVHLAREDAQWSDVRIDGVRLDAQLLRIALPPERRPREEPARALDAYVRFHDLSVTYAPRDAWGLTVQACWRAIVEESPSVVGVELRLSLETDGPIERPEVHIVSRLSAERVDRVGGSDSRDAGSVVGGAPQSRSGDGTPERPIVAFHGPFGTYLEMARLHDFDRTAVRRTGSSWELTWTVNEDSLEKGVLRRACIRAVFAPTCLTAEQVAAVHDSFLAQPLPLAT